MKHQESRRRQRHVKMELRAEVMRDLRVCKILYLLLARRTEKLSSGGRAAGDAKFESTVIRLNGGEATTVFNVCQGPSGLVRC